MSKNDNSIIINPLSDIIPKRKGENYEPDEKLLAIAFLDASQREFDGVMTPQFLRISETLSIPESTLRNWWRSRDDISRLADRLLEEIPKAVVYSLSIGSMQIIRALQAKGYENMSARDLNNLLNTYINKIRLLSGGSTSNVAHHHTFTPIPPKKIHDIKSDDNETK